MRAIWKAAATLAAVAALNVGDAHAQAQFLVGGGASVPTGAFADVAETGWHGLLGVNVKPPMLPLGLRADAMFNRLGSGVDDLGYQVMSGTASFVFSMPGSGMLPVQPYLLAGGGVYSYKLRGDAAPSDESQTDIGIAGGIGVNLALGGVSLFGEARYHNVFTDGDDLRMLPVTVGLRIGH